MHYTTEQLTAETERLTTELEAIEQEIIRKESLAQEAKKQKEIFEHQAAHVGQNYRDFKESVSYLQQDRDRIQKRLDDLNVPVITVDYNSDESLREAAKELSELAQQALRNCFLELNSESQLTDYLKVSDKCLIHAHIYRPLFAGFRFSCSHREQNIQFQIDDKGYNYRLYFDNFNLMVTVKNAEYSFGPKVIAKLQ